MIPYILAAVGGYLIGDSMKRKFAEGGEINVELNRLDHWQIRKYGFLFQIGIVTGEFRASVSNDKGFFESKYFKSLQAASVWINTYIKEVKHYHDLKEKTITIHDINENIFNSQRLYHRERMDELGFADDSYQTRLTELKEIKSKFDKLKPEQKKLIQAFVSKWKSHLQKESVESYLAIMKRLSSTGSLIETAEIIYTLEKTFI